MSVLMTEVGASVILKNKGLRSLLVLLYGL